MHIHPIKKVAVLVDGGHLRQCLKRLNSGQEASAEQVMAVVNRCIATDEELFRAYYYDSPPLATIYNHPFTGASVDFSKQRYTLQMQDLQEKLRKTDRIAFRRGALGFNGWRLTDKATRSLLKASKEKTLKPATGSLNEDDVEPNVQQKRVDVMIGLDIAWLSSKSIVDRILLVTADTDFIPAMKFARREGVQIVVVTIGDNAAPDEIIEHADIMRQLDATEIKSAR